MKRLHLIELHEQPWYPAFLRRIFQRGLGRALILTDTFENFRGPFREFLERTGATSILDMCSGSGDAITEAWSSLATNRDGEVPTLFLSDLYPNTPSYEKLQDRYPGLIDFFPESVNVMHPPTEAPRIRTLFNSLHHFRPNQVRTILKDAAENADGIATFEATGNTWGNNLQTLFVLPFAAAFLTAFLLRPVRLTNILFSTLIPVIPITALFDGLVSNFRTYSVSDLEELTRSIDCPNFEWQAGTVKVKSTGLEATYLFGWRTDSPRT